MTSASVESPQRYARVGGLLYLIIIVAGATGELFIRGRLIVPRDAALTAHNILAAPFLWRVGIAGDLVMHVCDVGLMLVFYVLLRPVSRNLAACRLVQPGPDGCARGKQADPAASGISPWQWRLSEGFFLLSSCR